MQCFFRIFEVFRPPQRKGPILVGNAPPGGVPIGSRLVSVHDAQLVVKVISIDFPTQRSLVENRVALVVEPDLGDEFRPGAAFYIVSSVGETFASNLLPEETQGSEMGGAKTSFGPPQIDLDTGSGV